VPKSAITSSQIGTSLMFSIVLSPRDPIPACSSLPGPMQVNGNQNRVVQRRPGQHIPAGFGRTSRTHLERLRSDRMICRRTSDVTRSVCYGLRAPVYTIQTQGVRPTGSPESQPRTTWSRLRPPKDRYSWR
jgi:hypothetical protein